MSEPGQADSARSRVPRPSPARVLGAVAVVAALGLGAGVLSASHAGGPITSMTLGGGGSPSPTSADGPAAPGPSTVPTAQRVAAPRPPPFTSVRRNVRCTGPGTPAARRRAALVQNRVGAAAAAAGAHVAAGVEDLRTGVRCSLRGTRRYDSASIVKVTIVATLLRKARAEGRALSSSERTRARASITRSDNAATTAMWRSIGRGAGMQRFLTAARMTRTVPGSGQYWGLTQVTADDELKLLAVLARDGVLTARERGFLLGLMRDVVSSQRWGVPAGAPAKASVANKNGWLPRATAGWRVHSIGQVSGGGRAYTLSLLSDHNSSWDAGITRLETLARAAHLALR